MIFQGFLQVRCHLPRQKYFAKAFWGFDLLGNGMTKSFVIHFSMSTTHL
jgi:hypothetical protein